MARNLQIIFVHRYKWSHEEKRKIFLKAFKEGRVDLIRSTRDGWHHKWRANETI